jgi:hypothetical protein
MSTGAEVLADGLYRVAYKAICAGFVIEKGCVTLCAPILRKRLAWWMTIATRVACVEAGRLARQGTLDLLGELR